MKKHMRIWVLLSAFSLVALALALPALAQDDDLPEPVQDALSVLSNRLGVPLTIDDVTLVWERRTFSDASLGCPRPGVMYAQVVTPGYQVLITYEGITYDYRVPERGSAPILCENEDDDIQSPGLPTITPAAPARIDPAIADWSLAFETETVAAQAIAWGPDGQLAAISVDLEQVGIVLYADGDVTAPPQPIDTEQQVTALTFSDADTVLAGTETGDVLVISVGIERVLRTVEAHEAAIVSISAGPEGQIATLDADNVLRVWRLETGE